jgi:hypothetical protein
MLIQYIYNIFLVILFFIIKSIADKILFEFHASIFSKLPCKWQRYLNPVLAWRNKWKNGDRKDGEKFFGSSWVFILFTDFRYLIKFIQYNIIALILVLNFIYYHWIIDYLIYICISTFFEYMFSLILMKNKNK